MDVILVNWVRVKDLLAKLGIVVPPKIIDGVLNFKDGAAELLLEELYRHFTGRQISKVKPQHRIDFSDHAYQVYLSFGSRVRARSNHHHHHHHHHACDFSTTANLDVQYIVRCNVLAAHTFERSEPNLCDIYLSLAIRPSPRRPHCALHLVPLSIPCLRILLTRKLKYNVKTYRKLLTSGVS